MANREEEVNTTKLSKQFVEPLNDIKPKVGLELQVMCPSLLNIESQECIPQINENLGESKQIQLSVEIPQQPLSIIVEEDSN